MSLRDRIYMPPLQKYSLYGRFPWKITVHLLIVIFTTIQVILVINRAAMYSLGHNILWNFLFLDKDANGGTEDQTINSYNLFTETEVSTYVQQAVNAYYNVNDDTFAEYHFRWTEGEKNPPKLWVEYIHSSYANNGKWRSEYDLTRLDLGPFAGNTKEFLNIVKQFEVKFELEHHIPGKVPLASKCYMWSITQLYDFSDRGVVNVSLLLSRTLCKTLSGNPLDIFHHYQWVSLVVMILAFLSFIIVWRNFMQRTVILTKLQGVATTDPRAVWESLGLVDKLKFFNFWVVVALLSNLLQIFGAIESLVDEDNALAMHETFVGFGCFFAWVNIVGYLPHNSPSYTIVNTIKRAGPVLAPYVVGVLPIFMAYAFLGIGLFWSTGYYPSVMYSMMMLFANVNGDTLYTILSATSSVYFLLGQAYYFSFLVFFICCVQNIFLAMINEGFLSLYIRPVLAGDEADDEDETDFRPELYAYTMSSPKARLSDKELSLQTKQRNADLALRMILKDKPDSALEREDNTRGIKQEMTGIEQQIVDLVVDLYRLYVKEKEEDVEKGVLLKRILDILETEVPELLIV